MTHYDFTLKFALGGQDKDPESALGALLRAGCDDALVGIGKPGQIALDFSREADSAEAAVLSALEDVRRALPDATFIEAAPDFVGIPDIASVLDVSRQYIGKILERNMADFPLPVHSGTRAVWHLDSVLTWMSAKGIRAVDSALMEVAQVTMRLNFAKESRRLAAEMPRHYLQAVR